MHTESIDRDLSKLRVVGWPRSGTHHVADLFRLYFLMHQSGDDITCYCLPEYLEPGTWGVYVYRDPRDILVSRFIQMYFRFEDTYQEILNGRTLADTFTEWFVHGWDPHVVPQGTTWQDFISSWEQYLPTQSDFVAVRHEALVANRRDEFGRVLQDFGVSPSLDQVEKVYEAVLRTKRYPYLFCLHYWEGNEESLPAGLPGEWYNLMDRETALLVNEYCGNWMFRRGYILDPDWWRACPVSI